MQGVRSDIKDVIINSSYGTQCGKDTNDVFYRGVYGQSSSKNIFPKWAETLGISPAKLVGIDLQIHDEPEITNELFVS